MCTCMIIYVDFCCSDEAEVLLAPWFRHCMMYGEGPFMQFLYVRDEKLITYSEMDISDNPWYQL